MIKSLRFAALGAALAYFFDPSNGRRRRKATIKRFAGFASKGREKASGIQQRTKDKTDHAHEEVEAFTDDVTLVRNVESEIFRDPQVPKDKVSVDADHGKVVLSGEVDSPELIEALVGNARRVQGVEKVESLLHTPGEPAPSRAS